MKFVQLILKEIIKSVATRRQILKLITPNSISVTQTPLRSLQRSPDPLDGFKGA